MAISISDIRRVVNPVISSGTNEPSQVRVCGFNTRIKESDPDLRCRAVPVSEKLPCFRYSRPGNLPGYGSGPGLRFTG